MPAIDTIQLRRGTAAAWTSENTTLAAGEPGFETDTGRHKVGDGVTAWNSLAYAALTPGQNLADVADAGSSRNHLQIAVQSAVAAVATSNVNIASPGGTFDGYAMQAGDEVLLAGQTTGSQNGIWTWNGAASALTRPNEFPSGGVIKRGRIVQVANGNTYGSTVWVLDSTAAGLTIDTTAQAWRAPVVPQSTNPITAAFGPITSPAPVPIPVSGGSGTFTAWASTVKASELLSSIYYGKEVGNGAYILYVGPHGTTPLARASQGGALQANVQEISVGKAPQLSNSGVISNLVVGQSYDWVLTVAIVGYAWGVTLPEVLTSVACSGLIDTLLNSESTGLGGVGGVGGESFPPFNSTVVAFQSAANLHILVCSHVTGDPKVYLTTGNGYALRAGRTTGGIAVSPNGQKIAVSNYSNGNVDIFDVTNAANAASPPAPVTATTTFGTNTPFALAWGPDNSTLYVVQYAASGTCQWQKITGANGASPAVGSAQNLDANALGIVAAQVTPDGTKLVTASGTHGYIVNTSTNAVTTFTLPAAAAPLVASNTLAYAVAPSNTTLYSINLSNGTVTAVNSSLNIPSSGVVATALQPDNNSLFVFTNAASGQVRQLDLRTGQVAGTLYTSWGNATSAGGGATGAVGCAAISALGDFFVTQASWLNIWPGGQVQSLGAGFGHVGSVNFTPAA